MKHILLIISFIFSIQAEEQVIRIDDIESLVKQNLSEIKIANKRINQSQLQTDVELSRFGLKADIASSYSNLTSSRDNLSFAYSPESDERFSNALQLSHYIYGFGQKKWARAQGKNQTDKSLNQKKQLSRNLIFRARLSFWDQIFRKNLVVIANQRLKFREEEQQDTTGLFEAGTVNRVDLLQSQVNAIQSSNALRNSQGQLKKSLRNLQANIGLQNKTIILKEQLSTPKQMEKLFVSTEKRLLQGLNIQSYKLDSLVAQSRIEQIKALQKPELVGYASAGFEGYSAHEQDDGWQVGVSLNWNLIDGRRKQKLQIIEQENINANDYSIQIEIRERTRIYQGLLDEWESLYDQLYNQQRALDLAKENYEIAREQFRAGLIKLTQVSDINLQFFENQFRLISLQYDAQVIRENLLFLAQ